MQIHVDKDSDVPLHEQVSAQGQVRHSTWVQAPVGQSSSELHPGVQRRSLCEQPTQVAPMGQSPWVAPHSEDFMACRTCSFLSWAFLSMSLSLG